MGTNWADAQQIEWFELKLKSGSDAEAWFEGLDTTHKVSMQLLKAQFDLAYPADPNVVRTPGDKWRRLKAFKLTEKDMMSEDEGGITGYATWATQMQKYAAGVDDADGTRAEEIYDECIPAVLRELTEKGASFTALAANIRKVRCHNLVTAFEKEVRICTMEAEIAALKRQPPPEMPTKGVTAAFTGMGLGRAQPPPMQSLLASFPRYLQQPALTQVVVAAA